jgi:hypothetical protein
MAAKSAPNADNDGASRIDDERQLHPPTFPSTSDNVAFGRS